ncbi:MAG: pantoate--beta-alanine ligase [Rhodospirillaceae bacterium]|nr:MAG: pantoate--beta-alanine ligase [Rhodospirillaceae bacterium]
MTLYVTRTIADLRAAIGSFRRAGAGIGLVPTMGALHDGHLALIGAAKARGLKTVATIFVNPRQFGPREDLATYPRDEAGDLAKLDQAGTDLLFVPDVTEMYPQGFSTAVSVSGITEHLCGAMRPHFFGGVATVVTKLLLQASPDAAFFGEKDFQQLQVIRRFTRDLNIPVEIVGVPTVREADGLAMSSRNRYLSPDQRRIAGHLPRVLRALSAELADGKVAGARLDAARNDLLSAGFDKIDYLELCDVEHLQPIPAAIAPSRVFAAAFIGNTRLIDNWPVG